MHDTCQHGLMPIFSVCLSRHIGSPVRYVAASFSVVKIGRERYSDHLWRQGCDVDPDSLVANAVKCQPGASCIVVLDVDLAGGSTSLLRSLGVEHELSPKSLLELALDRLVVMR